MEEASIRPARLEEGTRLQAIFVGPREPWSGTVAYLDGIQRFEVIGYAGSSPIVLGEISAAVRERQERTLRTRAQARHRIAFARASVLRAVAEALSGVELRPLPDEESAHPLRDMLNAVRALEQARWSLMVEVGERYRAESDGWLVIDGSLAESPGWAADSRAIGIAKSHPVLPFQGRELEEYLRLPEGHRSSIYSPVSRSPAPIRAWGLRLWPWEGRDLLYGLVRIEVAPANATTDMADRISRWLLSERSPVSAPDRHWDRLLYGIYSVEQYLRARM
jgi:hypothetical protein